LDHIRPGGEMTQGCARDKATLGNYFVAYGAYLSRRLGGRPAVSLLNEDFLYIYSFIG
jgi:hypothetical protein